MMMITRDLGTWEPESQLMAWQLSPSRLHWCLHSPMLLSVSRVVRPVFSQM